MVLAARNVILGGVRFTAAEAQFLGAGIRQGLGVRQLRSIFRSDFGRGLPSSSFTAMRRTLTQSELAGVRLSRLKPGRRLTLRDIPRVQVTRASHRFVLTGNVRTRIRATGQIIERFIRFGTNEIPTLDEFNRRAKEIIDLGVEEAESDLDIESVLSFGVVEQFEL